MAQVAGTTDTYRTGSGGGNREDLEDVIWDLFAEDTWALTNLDKVSADATFHEHLLDSLVAATTNRQIEGDDAAYITVAQPTRVGNYQQVSRKTFLISRTQEKVAKAGRKTEAKRQTFKQMKELKQDMEKAIVTNQASSAGGSATARSSAGMESWIATNESLATTTASASTPGFAAGVVAAPTDGTTTGALTEGALKAAVRSAWAEGGNVTDILVGTTQKEVIDVFTGVATRFIDVGRAQPASIIATANLYKTSYGTHAVRLHRYVRASVVLCLDPEYWAISFIDRPFMEELAKTGDGKKYQIVSEYGLVSRNEKASGKVVACA